MFYGAKMLKISLYYLRFSLTVVQTPICLSFRDVINPPMRSSVTCHLTHRLSDIQQITARWKEGQGIHM